MLALGVFSPIPIFNPEIDSVSPSTVAHGQLATISGLFSDFGGADVTLGGVSQQVVSQGWNSITFIVDGTGLQPGTYTLRVTSVYGTFVETAVMLSTEIVSDTVITAVNPETIAHGESLVISGANFYPDEGTVQLVQGATEVEQTVTDWNSAQVTVTVDTDGLIAGAGVWVRLRTFSGVPSNLVQVVLPGAQTLTTSAMMSKTLNVIPFIADPKRKTPKYFDV